MLEVEIKLQPDAAALAQLRERLADLCTREPRLREQEDLYFAHPSRDLKSRDEALRLRYDDGLVITWKGPKLDPPFKTREEIEFALGTDLDTATRLLEALGFRPVARVSKLREEWCLVQPHEATVCLDQVADLGTFAEVEVLAEEAGAGRHALKAVLEVLGLSQHEAIETSYLGLLDRTR
jgi:adenylate cyclase class 2